MAAPGVLQRWQRQKRGKSHFLCLGGKSVSHGSSGRRPPPLSDDDADFSFIAARSAFMAVISVERVFNDAKTSARVGSVMAGGGWSGAAEVGDGGGVAF